MHRVLLILVLIACFNIGAEAIWCYQCDSIVDDACGDPFSSSDAYARNCNALSMTHVLRFLPAERKNVEPVCVKSISKIQGDITTFRGCSFSGEDTCGEIKAAVEADGGTLEHCSICSEFDLCNFAPSLRVSLLSLLSTFIVLYTVS